MVDEITSSGADVEPPVKVTLSSVREPESTKKTGCVTVVRVRVRELTVRGEVVMMNIPLDIVDVIDFVTEFPFIVSSVVKTVSEVSVGWGVSAVRSVMEVRLSM